MAKKIALIIQRYGLEVNGGAEYHGRLLAERLAESYDIEVLTSCAKDYITWANEYQPGISNVNNIQVNRFEVEHVRNVEKFKRIGRKLKKRSPGQKLLAFLTSGKPGKVYSESKTTRKKELQWIEEQGPYTPNLIKFIKENNQQYDALIFFTSLYYTTVAGIEIAPEKSILIPTAHDEPPMYMEIFQQVFKAPKAILYNTNSEKAFVNKLFNNSGIYSNIAGIGIDAKQPVVILNVKDILNTESSYILYIGRIEPSKECGQLMNYFIEYKKLTQNNLKLVFVGQPFMKLIENPDIIYLGFVSEDVKLTLLKNSAALVIPSIFESLSLVTLESMAHGVPVIANSQCQVIKDHIDNSKAGFLYNDQGGFNIAVDTILNPVTDRAALSINARNYIAQNYTWERVLDKISTTINYVINN